MQRYRQKTSKIPQKWEFSPFVTPKIFFQKSGSVTFVPLWCSNFMQKIRKSYWTVSEISKDGPWRDPQITDGQRWLHRTLLDKSQYKITQKVPQNGNLFTTHYQDFYTSKLLRGTMLCSHTKIQRPSWSLAEKGPKPCKLCQNVGFPFSSK